MPTQNMPLPLLVGRDGFHETPLDEESCRGMLVVRGKPHLRDGVLAQRCLCGCSQRACGLESDVDVRFLNDPSNFEAGECVFRGPLFFPPYAEVVEVARSRGITNTAKYREAFARGHLPRCSPFDPSEYKEWISWADFTGIPNYHSDAELYNGLIALELNELALLPTPELRRFLLSCEYWASIRAKAAELGIAEKDIPANIGRIAESLSRDSRGESAPRSPTLEGGGAGAVGAEPKPQIPQSLTLAQKASVLVNTVTKWLPNSLELQQEIITGFYCNAWEILDRQDAVEGNGFECVRTTILDKLVDKKPQLVTEFLRQYDGAAAFHINGRNWMQAYSLWYSHEHRRFINWSSAGLGKTRTVPAIVAVFDIGFTIIFSPKKITNDKNPQLAFELLTEDPHAVIHYSDNGVPAVLTPGRHHYFVCNSEKLQQGAKTRRMIDALMSHHPGLIVFDEGHLLVSCNLIDPELGEQANDAKYKPRMEGLRYLLDQLEPETRIIVLTGTPVRVDAREGQALFELIGVVVGEFDKDMSELNALRLRGQLQRNGFQFLNYGLPELRRFIYPFKVPPKIAAALNASEMSTLEKEVIRMDYALQNIYSLYGKAVINTERVPLPASEASCVDSGVSIYELAELIELETDKVAKAETARQTTSGTNSSSKKAVDDPAAGFSALDRQRFPVVKLNYEPLQESVNPIFFTYFVDGPTAVIAEFLNSRKIQYLRCTGDSDDAQLGQYLTQKDSSLIASSSWSVGVDGSQKVSNALVTLGIPWHDSGHRQTVARIHRQGAETPDGTPTTVIHEIIPVAVNVNYDVKRLNKVYARRTFTEVLSLGEADALHADASGKSKYDTSTQAEIAAELKAAISGLFGEQMSMSITPQEEELATP